MSALSDKKDLMLLRKALEIVSAAVTSQLVSKHDGEHGKRAEVRRFPHCELSAVEMLVATDNKRATVTALTFEETKGPESQKRRKSL